MKKPLFLGVLLALTAMLMLSCNKNRFDLDHLESVEGSGQWKLPIGTAHTTLGNVLKQLGENDLISYDEDGNLQVAYSFQLDNILKGSNFLSLGTMNYHTELEFPNPFPGEYLPEPIDTVLRFNSVIELNSDSAVIESAVIKTCTMILTFQNNLANVSRIDVSSSDITMLDGDSLHVTTNDVNLAIDLSGATFRLHDENGVADSTLTLNYAMYYQLVGGDEPTYHVNTLIGLQDLTLSELSGYIDEFSYEFAMDTTFSLPLGNVEGQLDLVGANISIKEKNTFENFYAQLKIDYAELYGGGAAPSPLFDNYPYVIDVIPSATYYNIVDNEPINVSVCTDYNAIRFQGSVGINPEGVDNLIVIRDTSSLGLGFKAVIPLQFNIPGVTYIDTLDLHLGEISAPDFVEKIVLNILFDSEMPFNLDAQLYTFNSQTGQNTGELLDDELVIKGSFDGNPVPSEASVSITHDRLKRLMEADKLIMHFGVDTGNQDVYLNLDNGLGLTLKADVYYGGSLDLNN